MAIYPCYVVMFVLHDILESMFKFTAESCTDILDSNWRLNFLEPNLTFVFVISPVPSCKFPQIQKKKPAQDECSVMIAAKNCVAAHQNIEIGHQFCTYAIFKIEFKNLQIM